MNPSIYFVLVCLVTLSAITDAYTGKIPNLLTIPAAFLGLAINFTSHSWKGALMSAEGLALGFGLLIVFYLFGGIGAGDVKLLSAIGSLTGPALVFHAFILSSLVGATMGLIYILGSQSYHRVKGNFGSFISNLKFVLIIRNLNFLKPGISEIESKNVAKLPYGVPIAIGTVLSLIVKW